MALDSVNTSPYNSNIYRPQPFSSLRTNMAQYYERTSDFVDEKFKELTQLSENEGQIRKKLISPNPDEESNKPRIQPRGMGTMIDMWI